MSTKVLVIPEDPRNNGYILKPVVRRIIIEAGRSNPEVTVLPRSRLNGITNAKEAIRYDLAESYGWMDLWLFLPDADRMSQAAADALEQEMREKRIPLICCPANPEVEAWMLAGHRQHLSIRWQEVAGHPHFKEEVFDPFMERHGYPALPGMGREKLTYETLQNYPALKQLCPEISRLEDRIRQHFT